MLDIVNGKINMLKNKQSIWGKIQKNMLLTYFSYFLVFCWRQDLLLVFVIATLMGIIFTAFEYVINKIIEEKKWIVL